MAAVVAVVDRTRMKLADVLGAATQAGNAARPAQVFKNLAAFGVCRIVVNER